MEIKNKVLQVAELEEFRSNLLLENQQLRENVSGLQSTIQNLENSSSSSFSLDASSKVYFCYPNMVKIYTNTFIRRKIIFSLSFGRRKGQFLVLYDYVKNDHLFS